MDAVAYSGTAATQRRRRLARVRLAELVAMRRAARPTGAPPSVVDPPSPGERRGDPNR